MATILQVEQGGTGVQTVAELKTQLDLKEASHADISNNYEDTSQSTVPSSYALSEALQAIASAGVGEVVPIEKGGTGATTAEEAIRNLGIQNQVVRFPIQIANGGTGATDATTALNNLGISLPLPIESGGTGGNSVDEVIKNLFGGFPIPLEKGGTGGETTDAALQGLGLGNPIKMEYGGTGASDIDNIKKNLEFNKFFVNIIEDGADLDNFTSSGIYISQGEYSGNLVNVPLKDAAGSPKQVAMLVISNYNYNTVGDPLEQKIITQILFYLDSTNINLRNRMFIRCRRTKNNEQQPWSPWEEFYKGKISARGPMVFFVDDTTGSDTLDVGRGNSIEKPFKTIQAAINYVCQTYDFLGHTMKIQITSNTYPEWISIPSVTNSGGTLLITAEPEGLVFIQGSIRAFHTGFSVDIDKSITIQCPDQNTPDWNVLNDTWIGVLNSGTGQIRVGCTIDAKNNEIPNLEKECVRCSIAGGVIEVLSGASFSGKVNCFLISNGGVINIIGDCQMNGSINSRYASVIATNSGRVFNSIKENKQFPIIQGSVTGTRYIANLNGLINVSLCGPNYFPGTISGVANTATGGIYQ